MTNNYGTADLRCRIHVLREARDSRRPRCKKGRRLQWPQFEAVSRFAPEGKILVERVLDSLILSNEAKRWSSASLVLASICRAGRTQKTPRCQRPR
jgi:hypothetical protein